MAGNQDDLLFFSKDAEKPLEYGSLKKWKVLIVDDEPEVHSITTLVLQDFNFEEKGLEFYHAYTAQEAKDLLSSTTGFAIILLDVVMETDNAGLDLVHWIRTSLKDLLVRIILRTGQPGAAPEKQVISKYDINDYKEKTELTDTKLWTSITVALRGYRDLTIITRSKKGLEKIVQASVQFSERQSLSRFFEGVLTQLTGLLDAEEDSLFMRAEAFALRGQANNMKIISATGVFKKYIGKNIDEIEDPDIYARVKKSFTDKESLFDKNWFVGYMGSEDGSENILLLQAPLVLGHTEQELIRVFTSNAGIALSNVSLSNIIEDTQNELIFTLGEVVESRSIETGHHVRRVAAVSSLLAGKMGLSPREQDRIRMAVPLHDIGKIGISDQILNKPGKLTEAEMLEMRKHTLIGYNLLRGGSNKVLQLAASIALNHHEQWDGQGYPQGLKASDIPLSSRITCVADVFDALLHSRVYKKAWDISLVIQYMKDKSGTQFDPEIIKVFLANQDEILGIMNDFKEPI